VVEGDFLKKFEGFKAWILATPFAAPRANQPSQRVKVFVQSVWNRKYHQRKSFLRQIFSAPRSPKIMRKIPKTPEPAMSIIEVSVTTSEA
jgi:hypothetical protein